MAEDTAAARSGLLAIRVLPRLNKLFKSDAMDATEITSVEDLITAVGGVERAADTFGVNRGSIYAWRRRGRLPGRLFPKHQQILTDRKIRASRALWHVELPEPVPC